MSAYPGSLTDLLQLTDICIKNGGDLFLTEVASREFMDNLVSILKMPALNHDVKETILRLVQNWSIAFEGKPTLSYVNQVYKTLSGEGRLEFSMRRGVLDIGFVRLQVPSQGSSCCQLCYG